MKVIRFLFAMILFSTLVFACNNDDDTEDCTATYDADIKAIIDSSCAYSGCHSGGTDANEFIPEASNDFTSYAGLESNLNSGTFATRVLEDMNMPPANFVPAGFPTELTQAQLDLITCWMESGYPEN